MYINEIKVPKMIKFNKNKTNILLVLKKFLKIKISVKDQFIFK